jgi:hypothetical protein
LELPIAHFPGTRALSTTARLVLGVFFFGKGDKMSETIDDISRAKRTIDWHELITIAVAHAECNLPIDYNLRDLSALNKDSRGLLSDEELTGIAMGAIRVKSMRANQITTEIRLSISSSNSKARSNIDKEFENY